MNSIDDFETADLPELLARAVALKRDGHGNVLSYSPKVFISLTQLCRDVCGKRPEGFQKGRPPC